MDQWLDSLSEDWISQPRSSHSNSNLEKSSSSIHSGLRDSLSQSRIPRYKPSNLSGRNTVASPRRLSGQTDRRMTLALTERNSSELNAAQPPLPRRASKLPSPLAARPPNKRVGSATSLSRSPQDTIQHKPLRSSPVKDENFQNTPDWKRRFIKGKDALGGQCDLFSPTALEKVFRAPNSESTAQNRRGIANRHSGLDEFPSSPPSFPSNPKGKPSLASQARAQCKSPVLPTRRNSDKARGKLDRQGSSRMEIGSGNSNSGYTKKNRRTSDISSGARSSSTSALARSSQIEPVTRRRRLHSGTPSIQFSKSSCIAHSNPSSQSPNSSLRQEYRDENISPFFISRHQTLDGRVDYAALDMSVGQLRGQMEKLRLQQEGRHSPCSSDHAIDYTEAKSPENSSFRENENEWTVQSLPDDLSMGTDAFVSHGGYVNMRRGGYSNEGSFQNRPLSPSSLPTLNNSVSRSHAPSLRRSRQGEGKENRPPKREPELPLPAPATPGRRPPEEPSSPTRTQSSGSPLKLFDKHDTFTKDRVSRCISKFEENMREISDQDALEGNHESKDSPTRRSKTHRPPTRHMKVFAQSSERSKSSMNNFGRGELDNHAFSSSPPSKPSYNPGKQEESNVLKDGASDNDDSRSKLELPLKSASDGSARASEFAQSVSQYSTKASVHHPRKSIFMVVENESSKAEGIPKEEIYNAQGKRLPHSSVEDSRSKRRRTLRASEEIDQGSQQINSKADAKPPMLNFVVSRKRKDALYDGQNQIADAETLAMRRILRPRTSTGGHEDFRDRGGYRNQISQAEDAETRHGQPAHDQPVLQDSPNKADATQVTRVLRDALQNDTNPRKASITTADFFSEAQQIMRYIRAQGCPQSGHESPQEVEPSSLAGLEESVFEDSPKDEFSRPPSRAGASLRRLREPVHLDARVVSHLRKFEEKGDFEIVFSSSVKSMKLEQVKAGSFNAHLGRNNSDDEVVVESDPPNLRIHRQPPSSPKRFPTKNSSSLTTDTRTRSLGSQTSGPSTGRSLPTGSSLGSSTKAMIVPETVSHLLTDQIAGMRYDQERQLWVKSTVKEHLNTHGQNDSESSEDVLGDIPDLRVDEAREIQSIRDHATSSTRMDSNSYGISIRDHATYEVEKSSKPNINDRPRTAEGAISASEEDDSARSKFFRFASSGPVPETRATSWGGDMLPEEGDKFRAQDLESPALDNDDEDDKEEAEHEISILEGRLSKTPTRSIHREHHARVVTVSFSSPLIGHLQTPYRTDAEPEGEYDGGYLDLDDSPLRVGHQPEVSQSSRRSSFDRRSNRRTSSRRISINGQPFIARPMMRLDEEDEIAFLQTAKGHRNSSMNMIVSTPLARQGDLLAPKPTPSGQDSSIGFHLSPLQDFTIHQTDQSINQERCDIVRRRGLLAAHETEKFALVTQHLVKKLTDLEPYEPYWDLIKSMNLRNQGLATLHTLEDFCSRLEELDVSDNSLDQLDGAPSSLRDLRVCRNHLSDLSTWGHLYNLQYLDVSHNNIQTFTAFQHLVHLRELKADDNEIDSLDGLLGLDGLLSLRLRGNLVRSIDFQNSNLKRLQTLDMCGNKLVKVANLLRLPAIQQVNFAENELLELEESPYTCATLETLDISRNRLVSFEASHTPNLRSLNLDRNAISHIRGIASLKRLETLSWREQSLTADSEFPEIQYQDCHNIHHLRLSNNILTSFTPSTPFLNLRTLELASTGLQDLCEGFGHKVPNLRILNLNYNALRDIRPLAGIVRLQTLLLAGNRINRLRQTASAFRRLGNSPVEIDLRQNPLTVGFYTPQQHHQQNLPLPHHPTKQIALHLHAPTDPHPQGKELLPSQPPSHLVANSPPPQAYVLPPLDPSEDATSRTRLDQDTQLRRRVYELMITESCEGLQVLDGLVLPPDRHGSRRRQMITAGEGPENMKMRIRLGELGVL